MALTLQGNLVFLHIPKTGGNWVTRILQDLQLVTGRVGHKHADFSRTLFAMHRLNWKDFPEWVARRHVFPAPPQPRPYFFTFVRHPVAWYESWYKFMSQAKRNWRTYGVEGDIYDWHPNAPLNSLGHRDFNHFVENLLNKRPGYVTELLFSYATPEVDFIGRQEHLRDDLFKVLTLAGLQPAREVIFGADRVGVSKPEKAEVRWDPQLLQEVVRTEYAAIRRFGYPDVPEHASV